MNRTPRISVIVPVYKVAPFIERCAISLMEQTFTDVEYIFVDDASPDESIDILRGVMEEYPDHNVRLVTHPVNRGLPAARNSGLAVATGQYVYHCDSDDWVDVTLLQKLYEAAARKDADIAYCDFYISFETNERYLKSPSYRTGDDLLRKGFLGGAAKYNVWNKLVRRSLYTDNGITFPEGHGMGEDMTMIQLAAMADRVVRVPEALYHYVKLNTEAFSNTVSERHLADVKFNMDRTISFLESRYGEGMDKEIAFFKLSNKLPFLICNDKQQYNRWKEWYPEANRYVMANHNLPLRTRLLQWMAAHNIWLGVRAYYLLVYKFVYGVLYR